MNSFADRQLRVTLILAGGNTNFPNTNSNTLTLTNLRVAAKVESVARLATQMSLKIYGMTQADMNALTVAWANPPIVLDHIVILEAAVGTGWTKIFSGTIIEAQPEFRAAPDVYFSLLGRVGYYAQISPAPFTSYKGATTIATIVKQLAGQMKFNFVDGGTTGVLNNPYFAGTLYDQMRKACADTNTDFYIQGDTILICDSQKANQTITEPAVILNQNSGLVGYPVYDRAGLNVTAIFDPAFLCGTPVQIESTVPSATGRWFPYALSHDLESRAPKGNWVTHMKCLRRLV